MPRNNGIYWAINVTFESGKEISFSIDLEDIKAVIRKADEAGEKIKIRPVDYWIYKLLIEKLATFYDNIEVIKKIVIESAYEKNRSKYDI